MVKVPGTEAGARAVQQLLADGINVNITLLFALTAYERDHSGLHGRSRGACALRETD
jgi:transaldolase